MENIILFASMAIYIITILIQFRIFARTEELIELKSTLVTYINDNFVRSNIYTDNHKSLQAQVSLIHQDVSEVKNLLISIVNNPHNSGN